MSDPVMVVAHDLVDLGLFLRQSARGGALSDVEAFLRDHTLEDELVTCLTSLKAVETELALITHNPMSAFGLVGPLVGEFGRLFAPVVPVSQ
ncbi:MAG: hypothetical protein ACRDRO_23425 [Pseudonocardiaceae bacterium]